MHLIQPLKFRTWETEHFKMPHFETPRLQTAVFQMVVTVASGLNANFQKTSQLILL